MPKLWATASLCLALVGSVREAHAQTSANDKAAAEALFQEGKTLFQQGQYEQACAKFAASQELDGGFGTLMNLGECFEKRKLTASAWATFSEAAGLAHTLGQGDREVSARARAAALEAKLPKLVVHAGESVSALAGLEVRLNGTPLPRAVWGTAVPVDPGPQHVEVSAPGYRAFIRDVVVAEGAGQATLDIPALEPAPVSAPSSASAPAAALAPALPAPESARANASSGSSMQRTIGYVVGGAGVVAAVIGSVFGVRAISKNSDSEDLCRTEKLCPVEGLQLRDDARDAAKVSTLAFVASGALVATGLTLVLTAPSATSARGERREPYGLARLELTPFLAPVAAGVGLKGAF
jgi:hypothetical protein